MQDEVIESAAALRRRIEAMMNEMVASAARLGMPDPPPGLDEGKTRMRENTYRVLVMGEAKRGKSTFINSLMGDAILPTNVSITTSQVFHVQYGDEFGYRLRFEDDTFHDIRREELSVYGREQEEEEVENPSNDSGNVLRWIEVEGPFTFIPQNISLLDSPGLGSLYAEHGRVTQRFVPQSDAVIFVLSSGSPIGEFEIKAVSEILNYTRHIFFVQTQVDLYGEDAWTTVLKRNRDILNDLYFGKIGNPKETIRVWPISGMELLKANRATKPQYRDRHLADSHFNELWRGFRRFLFQATGCARIAQALEMSTQYQQQGKRLLTEQIKALQDAGSEKRAEMQEKRKLELEAFLSEWGYSGSKRKELENNVRQVVRVTKQQFLGALTTGGRLERYFSDHIEAVDSVTEAKQLAENISTKIPQYAARHWGRCAQLCRAGILQVVLPALGETGAFDSDLLQGEIPSLRKALRIEREVVKIKDDPLSRVGMAWRGAGMFIGIGGLLGFVPGMQLVGPALAGGMFVKNLLDAGKQLTEQTLPGLRLHLTKVLTLVRSAYTETSVHGELGIVDRYFGDIERTVLDRIQELVEQRKQELQQRIKDMEDAVQGDVDALKLKIEQVQLNQAEWSGFATQVNEYQRELSTLYNRPLPESTKLPSPPATVPQPPAAPTFHPGPSPIRQPTPADTPQEKGFRAACYHIVRMPTKEERNEARLKAIRESGMGKEATDRIYLEEWKKKEIEKAAANPVNSEDSTTTREDQYRATIRRLHEDGDMSDADYEQLSALADLLKLSHAAVRRLERQEGV